MGKVYKTNQEGQIIRERRIELGLTQEQAAMELGISLQQYQRYEYGERKFSNCPMRIGLRICALLELDPFEIIESE
ncbi:MAG: helix-turn-helix transcriptional regulator [Clostridia bacterium]|nr:helix-turn-helix transcriptional regulator [Clostridia bacterium]